MWKALARRLDISRLIGCVSRIAEEEIYANTLARLALRRANIVGVTQLHFNCGHDAQSGHRREHGDFQRRQWRVVEIGAVSRAGTHRAALGGRPVAGRPSRSSI